MQSPSVSHISEVIEQNEPLLLQSWMDAQARLLGNRFDARQQAELRTLSQAFLFSIRQGFASGAISDLSDPSWKKSKELLEDLSRKRVEEGFSPTETAIFVFSFKQPLFELLRKKYKEDAEQLAAETWTATTVFDQLGLYTAEAFQRDRERVIQRQQQEMLELSTPVVRLWDDILALPLIGTLDSARTQIVMQNMLEAIVSHSAAIAIIDITGVPTVDTLVAQHLLKTVAAARLMGADCIISGIRPQIAQTIIHLGVDLTDVITKSTLSDAFQLALRKTGKTIGVAAPRNKGD